MTYDVRRLGRKGFIQRVPRSQLYELISEGRRLAIFFTKTYTGIVNPSLAELDPNLSRRDHKPRAAAQSWRAFEHALHARISDVAITS